MKTTVQTSDYQSSCSYLPSKFVELYQFQKNTHLCHHRLSDLSNFPSAVTERYSILPGNKPSDVRRGSPAAQLTQISNHVRDRRQLLASRVNTRNCAALRHCFHHCTACVASVPGVLRLSLHCSSQKGYCCCITTIDLVRIAEFTAKHISIIPPVSRIHQIQ